MIQLQIPVERNSEFIDIGRNDDVINNQDNNISQPPDLVPDLLKSIKIPNRRLSRSSSDTISEETHSNSNSSSESEHSRTDSDISEKSSANNINNNEPCASNNNNNTGSPPNNNNSNNKNRELLLELNTHLSKAINEGRKPHWIYKINENDEDTWC